MDRHVRRHIELQPLQVAIQHNGVVAHIGQGPSRGRRAVEVRIDHDLALREIGNQHIVAVVETIHVIELDDLIAIADRVVIRERLQFQRSRSWIADDLVPAPDRQLTGDENRTGIVTVLDDLEESFRVILFGCCSAFFFMSSDFDIKLAMSPPRFRIVL